MMNLAATQLLPCQPLKLGEMVQVRLKHWLVEEVIEPSAEEVEGTSDMLSKHAVV